MRGGRGRVRGRVRDIGASTERHSSETSPKVLGKAGCGSKDNIGNAETRDRTGDLQIFSLTLSQLSYRGHVMELR